MNRDKTTGQFLPTKHNPEVVDKAKEDIAFMLDNGSYGLDEIKFVINERHKLPLAYIHSLIYKVRNSN